MKKTKLFGLSLLLAVLTLNTQTISAQNPIWTLPENKAKWSVITPGAPTPSPLPTGSGQDDYDGTYSENPSNAMIDAGGNLLFFVEDGKVFNENGEYIDDLVGGFGFSEIAIAPVPDNCDQFYIFSGSLTGTLSWDFRPRYYLLDLTADNGEGAIIVNDDLGDLHGQNDPPISCINTDNSNPKEGFTAYYAVTKLRPDDTRFLFLAADCEIHRYEISASGISYEETYAGSFTGVTSSPGTTGELEVIEIHDGQQDIYRIARPYYSTSQYDETGIEVYNLNYSTGGIIGSPEIIVQLSGVSPRPFIKGLEFSPNGEKLYFTHLATTAEPDPIQYYDFDTELVESINIQDKEDFQFSFIELGLDDKLYFVGEGSTQGDANRLATLSNPNNPNISTDWNDFAVSINYENGRISNFDYNRSAAYLLPDQIDDMDYLSPFEAECPNDYCCVQYSSYSKNSYTATSSETWTPSNNPLNGGTGAVAYIRDELVIDPGAEITIEGMTIHFAPDAKLIVSHNENGNGAELYLDNTTLTVDDRCCPESMWHGVEVWGTSYSPAVAPNPPEGRAIVEAYNNSVIEHALIGIRNYKPWSQVKGGLVKVSESTFSNNRIGIRLLSDGSLSGDIHEFDDCLFETTDFLKDPGVTFHSFVNLASVPDYPITSVEIHANHFINTNPSADFDERGYGIFSNPGASFSVRPKPPYIWGSTVGGNTFERLTYGIHSTRFANHPPALINIYMTNFKDVWRGVYAQQINNLEVIHNKFEILKVGADGTGGNEAYGLYTVVSTGYIVEENEFTTSGTGPVDNTFGVIINHSGGDENEVYRNYLHDLEVGLQSQNTNGDEGELGTGLQWLCNTFEQIDNIEIHNASGKIRDNQGAQCSQGDEAPAGNCFTNATGVEQILNEGSHSFTYRHHQSPSCKVPSEYNNGSTTVSLTNCYTDFETGACGSCPVNYSPHFDPCGGIIIGPFALMEGEHEFNERELRFHIGQIYRDTTMELSIEEKHEAVLELLNNTKEGVDVRFQKLRLLIATSKKEEAVHLHEELESERGESEYLNILGKNIELIGSKLSEEEQLKEVLSVTSKGSPYYYSYKRLLEPEVYAFTEPIIAPNRNKSKILTNETNEELTKGDVVLYPNPVQDILTLEVTTDYQPKRLHILDLSGKLIISKQLNSSVETVDVANLNKGFYIIKVEFDNGTEREFKITKQ